MKRFDASFSYYDIHSSAVHEAGHVVVSMFFGDTVERVYICKDEHDYGATVYKDQKYTPSSNEDAKRDICMYLGGISAEKMFSSCHGYSSNYDDLKQIALLARNLVVYSGEYLPVDFSLMWPQTPKSKTMGLSDGTRKVIEDEIIKIIKKEQVRCNKILKGNSRVFKEYVNALKKEGELNENQIKRIWEKYRNKEC